MRIIDKIALTIFGAFIVFGMPGCGILMSLALGALFAWIMMKLADAPVIGNIILVIIALIVVAEPVALVEFVTYDAKTGMGLISHLIKAYPVWVSAAAVAATAFSVTLQFVFVKDHTYYSRSLWDKILALFDHVSYRRNYNTRYRTYDPPRTNYTHYEPPIPTYEDFMREFTNYRASFDRISLLVNDITESPEFMVGGFMTFDKINEVMSFIQDHNAHIEGLSRRFRSAGADEAREIMGDMRYVNAQMNIFEQDLKNVFAQMKARFAGTAGNSGSSSQHKRSDNATKFTSRGEQPVYFKGCETLDELNKRYKSLAKTYHPDMPTGDTETMAKINQEYDRLKSRFR